MMRDFTPAEKKNLTQKTSQRPEFNELGPFSCLIMFPIILMMSLLCQAGHAVDYGTDFVTAFPENLAYYFPAPLSLSLKITTFVPNTNVQIISGAVINTSFITTPQVFVVNCPDLEVNQIGLSFKALRIISDHNITVVSISRRKDSIQTNIVPPTNRLGVEYLVPSPDFSTIAVQLNTYNVSQFIGSTPVPMEFAFGVIIINAVNVSNDVTVTSPTAGDDEITLDPFQLILLPSNCTWSRVVSSENVAVIITNPCVDTQNCRCNMIAHQLLPTNLMATEFFFPSLNLNYSRLFVTSADSVDLSSDSQTVFKTTQPAVLSVINPGLIIDLIPKNMFSGCYLVHTTTQSQSQVLIIVETAKKDGLTIVTNPTSTTPATTTLVSSSSWNDVIDAQYSWALISLNCKSCVIWHPTSPIAVYILEKSGSGVTFGGPAISVNDEPDPNGCVVVPMRFELINVTMSWQEARFQCINKGLLLVSPNINYTQNKMAAALNDMKAEDFAWIGLRRNLVTSEWNWQNGANFNFANWDNSQPTGNLCVGIWMEPNGNFTWRSARCCEPMQPLCVRDYVLFRSVDWS
ncbi:hypothetical protein AMELA_G00227360 [Ameiurus melas]|uniref:C-type lectin domain-containing protein n=1 Tax=Ameiurus melas TaxID=219545 RepID=A0A7J6A075_AMEME|nr:hypothetical protein AMELA_G00227360 [Ameiurus melas]